MEDFFVNLFIIIIIFVFFIWGITRFVEETDELFGISRRREQRHQEEEEDLRNKILNNLAKAASKEATSIVNKNFDKLITAYRNLVSNDAFGEKNYAKFRKEVNNFIIKKSKTYKELEEKGYGISSYELNDATFNKIVKSIEKEIKNEDKKLEFNLKMSPYEYEHFCANEFNKNGWQANATSGSSDQGVDVIAKKGKVILVAQCKMFAKAVGNKAVQEVVAGMKYYNATNGIVIATNGFTKSAYALAEANNIKLIHHSEIKDL